MDRTIRRVHLLPMPFLLAVAGLLCAHPPAAHAAPPVELAPPVATELALDGQGLEPAWTGAAAIPAGSIEGTGTTPTVRVLLGAGKLWILADMKEDVGFSIGLKVMVCPDGTATAADAIQASFGPLELRGPRFALRGPKGQGRAVYRLEAAADVVELGRWSAEASIPLEDLGLPSDTTPIRLAVVVLSRELNRFAAAPASSAFESPASFAKLSPPTGGWSSVGKAVVDSDALAKADHADDERMTAWRAFLAAFHSGNVAPKDAPDKLIAPLDRALAARPDLAMIHVVKGDLLRQLGDAAGAKAAYAAALAVVPHLPEAVWAVSAADIEAFSEGPATMPSDYAAAFERIAAEVKKRGARSAALDAAEGALRYRLGEFTKAIELLEPVVTHYPVDEELSGKLAFAKKYLEPWSQELGMRKADEAKGLPRVRIVTSRGPVVLELFEDDAPNTVNNFVWLAQHGFYDGLAFHRVIPFFMAQGGDPFSKAPGPDGKPDARVGSGGPGYAIKTEPSRRRPFRGVVAMANSGPNTEGSQFFLTTGTSAHLEGGFSVFGRVLEGQDVVDRLVVDDRIAKVEIVRLREHEYRPKTVAGTPAPEPR